MEMTNTVIKILFDALNQPGFTNEAVGLTGYAIYKNIRILSNDLKDYQKAVDAAIKKYGKKNSDGYYIDQMTLNLLKNLLKKSLLSLMQKLM